MTTRPLLALDCDGVILNYNLAYARIWELVFGQPLPVNIPNAYHVRNAYTLSFPSALEEDRFYEAFDACGWLEMEPMPGAVHACQRLAQAGYELVVVTAMPVHRVAYRLHNLQALDIPVSQVFACGKHESHLNPKRQHLQRLQPVAFVDDLLHNFIDVSGVHRALIEWETPDNPNLTGDRSVIDSSHTSLADFADYWLDQPVDDVRRLA